MDKIKILHCADIHFDTPFKGFEESIRDKSREEIKEVFSNIIDLCNKEEVKILLIAGDVFDNYTVRKTTLSFISEELQRLKDTKVFISPGNHDPYNNKSFYKLINWPSNVHIFKGNMEKVILNDLKVVVHGAGFTESYVSKSMLNSIEIEEDYINIVLIHGELSNSDKGNEYNPILIKDIENSNVDYIALGHRHKFSGILKEGQTSYAYSGCPQGRGFDELGDKGVLLGEVSKSYVDLNFIKTSKRNYIEVNVDITGLFGYGEIKKHILKELSNKNNKNDIVKVNLIGNISSDFNIDEKVIENKLENDFYFIKVKDNTSVQLDLDKIENEYSVKGIFLRRLKEKLENASDDEKEIIELAIKLGIQSLTKEEVNLYDH